MLEFFDEINELDKILNEANKGAQMLKGLIPLNGYVLIKPTPVEEKIGSLFIPETVEKDPPQKGEVVAVPMILEHPQLMINSVVLFTKFDTKNVHVGNETFVLVKESDLLAVFA